MTHIYGPKEYWNAVFKSYVRTEDGKLLLHLNDGTSRTMENWGSDTITSEDNLKDLQMGDVSNWRKSECLQIRRCYV